MNLVVPESEDDRIIEVVDRLRRVVKTDAMKAALDIGRVVVEGLYGGDLSALRDKGRRDHTFRKLSEVRGLPVSPLTLWRAVAVYELVERFPGLAHAKHLGLTHLRAVLGLPPRIQEHLLRDAELHQWSVARLEQRAQDFRGKTRPRSCARRRGPIFSPLRKLSAILDKGGLGFDVSTLTALELCRLRERVEMLRHWCERVQREVGGASPRGEPAEIRAWVGGLQASAAQS